VDDDDLINMGHHFHETLLNIRWQAQLVQSALSKDDVDFGRKLTNMPLSQKLK